MRTAIRLLLVVLGCSLSASAEEAPNAHGRVFAVRTGVSEQRTVARRLVKTGSITAPVKVEIAPRVSGRLLATADRQGRELREGSFVRKGDLMATLDAAPYEAVRDAAKAALASCESELADAEREYARSERLVKEQTATAQELDRAETVRATARAAVLAAKAKLDAAELDVAETRIFAPMDGVIAEKFLYPGAMVPACGVLFRLEQTDPLQILFDVPTMVYPLLKAGETRVSVEVDAYPGERVDLKVDEIFPTADEAMRTIKVRSYLPNAEKRYAAGMYATGTIALNERPDVIVVPYEAVLRNVDRHYVYRVGDDEIAHLTPVEVGDRMDDVIEIKSGLAAGTVIVTEGLHRLADGVRIRVVAGRGQ